MGRVRSLAVPGRPFYLPRPTVPRAFMREVLAPSEVLTGASVRLKVDGMVCPFGAYGLEKRLEEIASIDAVLIRISDGLA